MTFSTGCRPFVGDIALSTHGIYAEKIPVEPDPVNIGEGI